MNAQLRRHRTRRSGGFTLLELLIATVMFSMIVAAMSSAFHGALRLRENAYEVFEERTPHHYAVATVKRDLRGSVSPGGILAGAMIGENEEDGIHHLDRLEFYSASGRITDRYPWGDLQKIEYAVQEMTGPDGSDAKSLTRGVTRNLLASTEPEPEVDVLMTDVQSLRFDYYDGEDWFDSWDSSAEEDELPLAIRVRVEFSPPTNERERFRPPIEFTAPIAARPFAAAVEDAETDEATQDGEGGNAGGSGNQPPSDPPPNGSGGGGRS